MCRVGDVDRDFADFSLIQILNQTENQMLQLWNIKTSNNYHHINIQNTSQFSIRVKIHHYTYYRKMKLAFHVAIMSF